MNAEDAGTRGLSQTIRLSWAIGQFAIAAHMAIVSVYLLFYLTDVQHLPGSVAGMLILLPRLWNVLTDPLVGGISDRVRSPWGRRRPFLLAGAVLLGLGYLAMFWMPVHWSLTGKAAWFLVASLVVNSGLSLYHVPYSAMVAEMTRSVHERVVLVSYKEIAARVAVLGTVLAFPLVVGAAATPIVGYRWSGVASGLLILISALVAFFGTAKAPAEPFHVESSSWAEQLRTFRANRPLFRLTGALLASSAADAFYSAVMIYFITVSLRLEGGLMGSLYPTGSLAAILMTVVWVAIGRRLGRKVACQLAFGGAAAVFALAVLIPPTQPAAMFPYMALLGAFMAGVFLLPGAIVPDTVEYDEARSGQRREGAIYGAWVFTQQTGMAFGTFLVGIFLDLIGYHAGAADVSGHTSLGLRLGFALVPAAMLLAGFTFLRPLELGAKDPAGPPPGRSIGRSTAGYDGRPG